MNDGKWLLWRAGGLPLALVLLAAGCRSEPVEPPGDAELARSTLTQVLDAWKAGKTSGDLKSGEPVVFARDEDWDAGRKLADYEILEEPVQNGGEWRVLASLSVVGNQGRTSPTRVYYSVTPGSPASVVRSDYLY